MIYLSGLLPWKFLQFFVEPVVSRQYIKRSIHISLKSTLSGYCGKQQNNQKMVNTCKERDTSQTGQFLHLPRLSFGIRVISREVSVSYSPRARAPRQKSWCRIFIVVSAMILYLQ